MDGTTTRITVFALAAAIALPLQAHDRPVLFEQHATAAFNARGNGYTVAIDALGLRLQTAAGAASLTWRGASLAKPLPLDPQPTRVNYFNGATKRTNIPTFGRLRAAKLYPGIDLVYYGTDRQLEYDFIVHPGANPANIRFSLPATLSPTGELTLANGLKWHKPVARQNGHEISARFIQTANNEFTIAVANYDHSKELVIDPVLSYGTYLGGTLADEARGVTADAVGNAYIVGSTVSIDFPGTTRGLTFGGADVYVAKLNPSGRALEWATYIGGAGSDTGTAIAIDATGDLYITGQTASTNFPVTASAPQSVLAGGSAVTDAFALKLSANGQTIVYSTYLGGALSDSGNAIAVDAKGSAYIAGRADSTDFPTTTRDTLPARGAGDGFVTKLSPDGSTIVYSALLGGFALDVINGLVVDPAGSAYVTGETRSDNFPVTDNAYQKERKGSSDAFVSKLSPDGATLVFSTYYGGDGQESGRGIALDRFGAAYVAGGTGSANLPVSFNGAQRAPSLLPDAFAAKFDPTGASLVYGTYIGGDAEEQANAISVDNSGAAYVAGRTNSANYPLLNDGPLAADGPRGGYDGFVTRLSSGGNFLQFSTYYGGAGNDEILSMATDARGRIWIAGNTDSTNLPTPTGSLATRAPGANDGFVALLSEINVLVTPGSVTLGARESRQFSATVTNTPNTAVRWSIFPDTGTISQTGLYTAPTTFVGSPAITVSAISVADGSKIGGASITLVNRVSVVLSPADVTLTAGQSQQFTPTVSGTTNTAVTWTITPAIGTISPTGLYTAPASFLNPATITVRATSVAEPSRSATSTVNIVLPPPPPVPVITAEGFTNAASFRAAKDEGGISAGEIITIFGTNLGPATPQTLQLDARGFVANRLGNTRVLFDGTPGAMIVTSAGQVSVVVPYTVEGQPSTAVAVEFEGRASNQISLNILPATPAIFTQTSTGAGPGSVIRQTGQLVTAAAPAAPGEVLTIFATGEGATTPAGVDGKPTALPLPLPKLPVKVVIDGNEIEPLYAGGAPGLVAGVLQVNFTMPPSPTGARRLRLKIGDKLSPDTVTINAR